MEKILGKRIKRDFRENYFRYLALSLMIILAMYLIVSLVGAAETIMQGTEKSAQEHHLEDGEFTLFVPLTPKEEESLTKQGITLEKMFYLDYRQEDGSTLRVSKNRQQINLIALDEGELPEHSKEVVLEKRYCTEHNLRVGDEIHLGAEGQTYTIVGIGSTPDYDAPFRNLTDSSVDSRQFGTAFVSSEEYDSLKAQGSSEKSEEYVYAYLLNGKETKKELKEKLENFELSTESVEDPYFQEYYEEKLGQRDKFLDGVTELKDGTKELSEGLQELAASNQDLQKGAEQEAYERSIELLDGVTRLKEESEEFLDTYFDVKLSKLTSLLPVEDNPRVAAAAEDQVINKLAGLAAGVIVMILFTYVISIFIIHGIDKESMVIGALYALGVKEKELLHHYLILPTAVTFFAGVIGTVLGYSTIGVEVQMMDCYNYFSIPHFSKVYSLYLLVYGVVMPPVAAVVVNYLVIRKRLKRPVLSLLKNEKKTRAVQKINLGSMDFVTRFRIRQMIREARAGFTVILGMFISMLILMLGIDCYVMCKNFSVENKADTKYEYMYTYKYPEQKVPKGGEACYAKGLNKEVFGYNLEVTLLGIREENPYFDAKITKSKSQVVISSAMAQKYGLSKGDHVVLSDEEAEQDYVFTVEDITRFSPGLYVFMEIDSMRELFGAGDDYYNVVFSAEDLGIDTNRLYSTTTRAQIEKSSDVFVNMMMPMIYMMTGVSILIFCVVMYLMMKVMLDRAAFSISMIKIFGYRKKEINKLYLSGNFYMVAAGAAVCIPLSKWVMDEMYPILVSNVACGMNLTFSWQMYAGLYLAILVLYFIINQFLVLRLSKMLPAEVLKNRE